MGCLGGHAQPLLSVGRNAEVQPAGRGRHESHLSIERTDMVHTTGRGCPAAPVGPQKSQRPSGRPPPPTSSVCDSWGVHVGILGGTGPAGRGVAVRLAQAGVNVTIGSRDAERAAGIAAELVTRWPDLRLPIAGAGNDHAATAPDLVIVATPWDSAIPTVKPLASPWRQGRHLHGQRPGEGGPRDAGAHPTPWLGRRRRPGCPARLAGGRRLPSPACLGDGEPRIGTGGRRARVLGPPEATAATSG